jgi:hypothetical protein
VSFHQIERAQANIREAKERIERTKSKLKEIVLIIKVKAEY